ncbi:hypothetical protein [Hydrogenovibrio sp. SC-1]|uniref:hypothetical protein n=1 Tax=Hydrogenovibrio sp. SC-1 TaxID=2065820 RepID=UPI0013043B73|nr:hypothetical protein [Hydrogenovibrio sp. SC-1]
MTDPNSTDPNQQKEALIKLLESLSNQSRTKNTDVQLSEAQAKQLADKLKQILKQHLN